MVVHYSTSLCYATGGSANATLLSHSHTINNHTHSFSGSDSHSHTINNHTHSFSGNPNTL